MIKKLTPALLIAALLLVPVASVKANPSAYATVTSTSSATTSPSFMTPGLATTTLVYDSYASRPTKADTVAMLTQFTGSSTSAILNVSYEYAYDVPGTNCKTSPSACDWYKDNLFINTNASSTQQFQIGSSNSFSWNFASSSQNGDAVVASNNRSLKAFSVPTPARYTKVIFSITGANGAVWAQFNPAKENN